MLREIKDEEIREVKALGEKMGYWELMSTASALWHREVKQKCNYPIEASIVVPTQLGFIQKSQREEERASHKRYYLRIRTALEENAELKRQLEQLSK